MCGGERENCNRDRRAAHVDGRTERDGDGVNLGIEPKPLAELEVDGNVRCRAARKECIDSALAQGGKDERERVAADVRPDDDRIHNECDGEECAEQNGEELEVADEGIHAARTNCIRDEPHDAERSETDDPEYDLRHDDGEVAHRVLRGRACFLESDPCEDAPCKDADVVRACDCVNWVVDDVQDEVVHDLDDTARRCDVCVRDDEMERRWEGEGESDSNDGCEEGRDDVEAHDGLQCRPRADGTLRHRVHDENEDEDRRDTLQGTDEDIAEHGDDGNDGGRDENTDDESDRDELDERCFAVLAADIAEQVDSSFDG